MNIPSFFDKDFQAPNNSNPNEWADYVEICCLSHIDQIYTLDASTDEKEDAENAGASQYDSFDLLEEKEENTDYEIIFPNTPKEDYEHLPSNASNALKQERATQKLRLAFQTLQSRAILFGSSYPFELENGTILTVCQNPNPIRHFYIVFLLSSNLRLATKSGITRIGNLFEQFCKPFFHALLPPVSQFYHFGAAASTGALFAGGLRQKIEKLCEILDTRKSLRSENSDLPDSGDGGLDWIAFRRFSDKPWNTPVFFAQCACGIDWLDKQEEAGRVTWKSLIELPFPTMTFLFTPRSPRTDDNNFEQPYKIFDELVLIDRYRMIDLVQYFDKQTNIDILNLFEPVLNEFTNRKIQA